MPPKTPVQIRVYTLLRTADRDLEAAESGLPSPFVHDLTSLATTLAARMTFDTDDVTAVTVLTTFAVDWRYDFDDAPSYTSADLVAMAHRFRDKLRPFVLAFLT